MGWKPSSVASARPAAFLSVLMECGPEGSGRPGHKGPVDQGGTSDLMLRKTGGYWEVSGDMV